MNDNDFKLTLTKALQHRCEIDDGFRTDNMWSAVMTLPSSNLYVEETSIFTHREWNTYCSILHIQVPIEKQEAFLAEQSKILSVAESIYGRQGDNLLTDLDIGILIEHYEVVDFSDIAITDVVKKAIADAEQFMMEGKYDSAFDRVHTAFHGYLRKILDNKQVSYEESDTLTQLYSKLHDKIANEIKVVEIAELVKKTMRSSSGAISAINEMRNRHSLSHPNEYIIGKREAEFAIKIIKDISDYINEVI
jgi:HEPN domain-containing protein